jgi:hypothetical protein
MDIKKTTDFFNQKFLLILVLIILGLLIVLLIFRTGMTVGERKCGFSMKWNDNYHQNFAPQKPGMRPGLMMDNDLLEASGANGQIIKIDGYVLILKSLDNVEKAVLVNDKTVIMRFRDAIAIKDLLLDEEVVVIGEPNEAGQIEAKFIRVLPKMPPVSAHNLPPKNF